MSLICSLPFVVTCFCTDTSSKTAVSQERHSEVAEHLAPLSPNELTAFVIRGLPNNLNKKTALEEYFKKYGKIQRIYYRAAQKMASIHFHNHVSKKKKFYKVGSLVKAFLLCRQCSVSGTGSAD